MNHSQNIITKCDGIITNCDSLVYFKVRWTVITNCDSFFITKWDTVYYKLRQVLQSAINLLQIATGITKCEDYKKLRQYSPSLPISAFDHTWKSDNNNNNNNYNIKNKCRENQHK